MVLFNGYNCIPSCATSNYLDFIYFRERGKIMPTWVVALINGVLLAYCVFMLVFGHFKKKKAIEDAKSRLEREMKEDENKVKSEQSEQENKKD